MDIKQKLSIQKPTLLLSRERATRNIERMAAKAQWSNVHFRPHFKTHQSAQIGEWFRPFGVNAITVSSVTMAQYFARHGWQNILVAFPANILEIEQINQLAGQVKLGLLVESVETVNILAQNLANAVDVWIKVDTGYGRTGIAVADFDRFVVLTQQVEKSVRLSFWFFQ
jgi:D-serine deaminase-like pyridoxal phosphate-dependent protein